MQVIAQAFFSVSYRPLISMSMVIGQITRLMARHLYALINSRSSWDSQVEINDEVKGELQFWYSHLPILNRFLIRPESSSVAVVYSDASQTGFGGYLVSCGHHEVAGHWDNNERIPIRPCVNFWLQYVLISLITN